MTNANVLIVEDDQAIAENIKKRLKDLEYTVCATVSTGAQAIEQAVELSPDIALINVELEGEINGMETAKWLHKRFDIPAIYLVHYPNDVFLRKEGLLERTGLTDPFDYIPQPYGKRRLYLSIDSALYKHRVEKESKAREQQLATIFNSIGDAVIVTDQGGLITFMNPAAEQLTDWQQAEAVNESVTKIFNIRAAETEDFTEATLMGVLHKGDAVSDNAVLISKTGQEIHIDYNISPLKDGGANITGVVLTFHNITKFREVESQLEQTVTELQERTQFMETVLNSSNDGIAVIGAKGEVLLSNPSMKRIFNVETKDVPPSEWSAEYGIFYLDKETHVPIEQNPIMRAIRQGEATSEEEFFIRNEGNPAGSYVSGSAIPLRSNENQEIIGAVAIARNITNRKQTEMRLHQTISELQDQTQLMDTIFNTISDGVIAADADGRYLMFNAKARETIGSLSEGLSIADRPKHYGLFYPDGKTLFSGDELPLTRALRGERTDNVELLVSNDNQDDEILINISGRPLLDGQGILRGGVIVFHDITEIKAAQGTLEQTVNDLRDQTQLMETVVNSMNEGLIVSNSTGEKILLTNPSVERMLGPIGQSDVPLSERSKKHGIFFADKKTYVPIERILSTPPYTFRDRKMFEEELFIRNERNKDGINIMSSLIPLFDDNQQITGWVNVIRDITKDKTAAEELTQMMSKLQEQAQLMETVFNSVSDGVVVTNEKGEFLFVNPSAERISGMKASDTPPEEWPEVYGTFYPDKVTPVPIEELPLIHAMQGQATDGVDLFLRNPENPNGVFINVSGRPLQGEDTVRGGVITFRDVTKIKETEAELEKTVTELQNQTQLMETIFNSISDGVVVADEKGQFIKGNPAAAQISGTPLEALELNRASEQYGAFHPTEDTLFPVDDLPLTQAVNGIATNNVEMRLKAPEVEDFYLSVSGRPLLDEDGTLRGGVAVARDITELKRAENQLRESIAQLEHQTQLMESIFNSISDGVVVADENGQFTMFNPSAERIVGMGAVEGDPDEWSDQYGLFYHDKVTLFPPEDLPLALALQGKETDEVEIFVRNPNVPDGLYISVNGRPLRAEDGISGGVAVFRDVTERVLAEEALAQAFAQGRLEIVETILHNIGNAINSVTVGINTLHQNVAENRLVNRFSGLANMVQAHEGDWADYIKNDPKGQQVLPFMIALAADFTEQNKQLEETLERVRDRVTHIVDIIRTQKASHQTDSMTRKNVQLRKAILNAVKLQQDSLDKRGIYVEVDCENAPEEIWIQESQFHQMLVNLCKNSIEAIDELIRSGGLNETPRIGIKAYISGDFLYLDVTDNGIGITPTNAKLIFTAGYTTKELGTGLGLHSSANFVIAAGGKIQPLSEGIGRGTTMRIMLRSASVTP